MNGYEWWKPKAGPVFTRGRLSHLLFGGALTGLAALLGGLLPFGTVYGGTAVGLTATHFGAPVWEWLTRVLAPHLEWAHPWGDILDFFAFILGAWLVGLPIALLV